MIITYNRKNINGGDIMEEKELVTSYEGNEAAFDEFTLEELLLLYNGAGVTFPCADGHVESVWD